MVSKGSTMALRVEEQRLAQAASNVRWWPAALALLVLGGAYALVSDHLRVGPSWWLLVLTIGVPVAEAAVLGTLGLGPGSAPSTLHL